MNASQRLALPFILPGQAQKELFHNEALQTLDLVVAAAVEEPPRNAPPGAPLPGVCYIIGAAPSGAWAGKANSLAGYTDAGWRFVAPIDGLAALIRSSGQSATYRGSAWEVGTLRGAKVEIGGQQVVGSRGGTIGAATGGSVVDSEARSAVAAILVAMRTHGLIAP